MEWFSAEEWFSAGQTAVADDAARWIKVEEEKSRSGVGYVLDTCPSRFVPSHLRLPSLRDT